MMIHLVIKGSPDGCPLWSKLRNPHDPLFPRLPQYELISQDESVGRKRKPRLLDPKGHTRRDFAEEPGSGFRHLGIFRVEVSDCRLSPASYRADGAAPLRIANWLGVFHAALLLSDVCDERSIQMPHLSYAGVAVGAFEPAAEHGAEELITRPPSAAVIEAKHISDGDAAQRGFSTQRQSPESIVMTSGRFDENPYGLQGQSALQCRHSRSQPRQ